MPESAPAAVTDLCRFLDASPSPYHAAATIARQLDAAGFRRLDEHEPWAQPGLGYVVRGGSVVAWAAPVADQLARGFRILGAHTDSPNLRIKPRPDTGSVGFRQLGVEVYGGALHNSWLDRDLGISGRVVVRTGDESHRAPVGGGPEVRLVRVDRPLLRIPQLAIHLDRGVNDGLKLNAQQHLVPVWGQGRPAEGEFARFLAGELGVASGDVLGWDVMLHDLTPAALLGEQDEFLSSARLDNLLSCWAGLRALLAVADTANPPEGVPVLCLFDHEEVGSESSTGAAGALLPTILERVALGGGLDRAGFLQALARSFCLSADGAHATHPNYPERHEPGHHVIMNAGPVLKLNANVRYATDAPGAAVVRLAAERADVALQEFVVRSDMPCGSTIGPVTSARLGIPTVDVGVAQLSMHSARELCGARDPEDFVALIAHTFQS